jgi:ATP-dependent helicase/nuclease subunit B
MGPADDARIDSWIREGGIVVTASERAARALESSYHRRRRREGLGAWHSPAIRSWTSFLTAAWENLVSDGRMLLNRVQEQSLWAEIIAREPHVAAALEISRYRMAGLALEAHERLSGYAPEYLEKQKRSGWDLDPGAFSAWLAAFDLACRERSLVSPHRTALETLTALGRDKSPRPPLLAAGFDRVLPSQRALFDAWGRWSELEVGNATAEARFYSATDEEAELAACARWCAGQIAARPGTRVLVLCQQIADRRGEIERAFLRHAGETGTLPFEFSLGIPLISVPRARAAFLVLRWLTGPLTENEIDWLFAADMFSSDRGESLALQSFVWALRSKDRSRPVWSIESLAQQHVSSSQLPSGWMHRLQKARRMLSVRGAALRSALDWAALVPELLRTAGFFGDQAMASTDFQVWRRWEQAIDLTASLGFDGRNIGWEEFLGALGRVLDDLLFAPESTDPPIQIAGPAESAGLSADALWFLGADENSWPSSGSPHPLIPLPIQRAAGMPHASPQDDWQVARAMSTRILNSAPRALFSFAAHREENDLLPSHLIRSLISAPTPLPAELAPSPASEARTVIFFDDCLVPLTNHEIHGGSSILTQQSQCPFKAFANARLGAKRWENAELGLSRAQRGLLLHAVLHAVWAGPPDGFATREDLLACPDLGSFIAEHVRRAVEKKLPQDLRDHMPARYLELESERLRRVLVEWLNCESERFPFTVAETEATRKVHFDGLDLDLRLDRIDRLDDGSVLVIDYKTGNDSPGAWQLPRPEDVQLPLYACFGLNEGPGGLVFAKVRVGNHEFTGRMRNALGTLKPGLAPNSSLVKQPLTEEQLKEWKAAIEQLARDFVAGRAAVDPREFPGTCENCGLHAVCRVHENHIQTEPEEELEDRPNE